MQNLWCEDQWAKASSPSDCPQVLGPRRSKPDSGVLTAVSLEKLLKSGYDTVFCDECMKIFAVQHTRDKLFLENCLYRCQIRVRTQDLSAAKRSYRCMVKIKAHICLSEPCVNRSAVKCSLNKCLYCCRGSCKRHWRYMHPAFRYWQSQRFLSEAIHAMHQDWHSASRKNPTTVPMYIAICFSTLAWFDFSVEDITCESVHPICSTI